MSWSWSDAPAAGYICLNTRTGVVGLSNIVRRPDGAPAVGEVTRILEPDAVRPTAAGESVSWSSRTTTDVEGHLNARGWRVMTRFEAANLLRAQRYELPPTSTGVGSILTQEQADATQWHKREIGTVAFIVRLADVPTPTRGSGPIACCGGHRDRCLFGHSHLWAVWFENAHLMRTPVTDRCYRCGGICTAEEADLHSNPEVARDTPTP
jgi:hypothetical protein